MKGRAARPRDHRLAVVAVITWAAALGAVHIPHAAAWMAVGAALAGACCLVPARRGRTSAAVGAIAAAVVVAVCAGVAASASMRQAIADDADGRAVEATGTVVSKVEPDARGALRFELEATSLSWGSVRRSGPATIAVTVDRDDVSGALLDLGSSVVVRGTAREGDLGDRAVLRLRAGQGVEVARSPSGPLLLGSELRRGFVTLAATLPRPGGALLPGLAVGDTSAVSAELDAAMKASSLSHLTAVSGANCAIVVWLAFAIASALRAPRAVRVGAAAISLVAFVVLVTPEPSVVRAGAMAAIALVAVAADRRRAGVAVLSLAIVVLLVMDPWLSTSLGFALSAAATAALLVLAAPLARGLARWMPRELALGLSVPLAAQLACGPLLIVIDPAIPVYGVLANLVAGPAAPAATVVGLAACLTAGIPGVGAALAWIAWIPASWIAASAETFAGLPGARLPWLEGWGGAAALAGAGAAAGFAIAPRLRARSARALQSLSVLAVAGLVGAAVGSAALSGIVAPATVPTGWSIAQCDVGQGDAVVVRSGTAVMLIDTGPAPEPLAACLRQLGVDTIDVLVLTHFDLDHVGGIEAVRGRATTVLHGPTGEPDDTRLLARLAGDGARLVAGAAGVSGTLGGASWRVLWPRAGSQAFDPGNDSSIVLDVRGDADDGMPAGLYLGDLAAGPQRALLAAAGLRPPYEVVKVAHHGSADQAPELYAAVGAPIALIGVGAGNDFGHPRDETLALFPDAVLARTDRDGLSVVSRSAGELHVWRADGGSGGSPGGDVDAPG